MTTPKSPPNDTTAPTLQGAGGFEGDEPSPEEVRAAAALRDALADPAIVNEDADLLRALALAERPRDLGEEEHRAILDRALASPKRAPRGLVIRVAFGVATATLAVAASVVLFVPPADAPPGPALARARSTQPLFHEPFARQGDGSARIDRIALARATDLRDNEFSRWGVR